jgi:hypothetical protein
VNMGSGLFKFALGVNGVLENPWRPPYARRYPLRRNQQRAAALTSAPFCGWNFRSSQRAAKAENFPTGFYLRNHEGSLWLRGYRSIGESEWPVENEFVFLKP